MENFWLPIKHFEGLYAVSDTGLVKSLDRRTSHGRQRKGRVLKSGRVHDYRCVSLSKNNHSMTRRVHRLVAEAFLSNPNQLPDVHHRDHDKSNNNVINLEWIQPEGNMKAAATAGKLDGVSRGYGVKLTKSQVLEIRKRLELGEKSETISKDFPVTGRTIRHIQSGPSRGKA